MKLVLRMTIDEVKNRYSKGKHNACNYVKCHDCPCFDIEKCECKTLFRFGAADGLETCWKRIREYTKTETHFQSPKKLLMVYHEKAR